MRKIRVRQNPYILSSDNSVYFDTFRYSATNALNETKQSSLLLRFAMFLKADFIKYVILEVLQT